MKKEKIILLFVLGILLLAFIFLNIQTSFIEKKLSQVDVKNIIIEDKEIDLTSLSLKQKLAQMIMVRGDEKDLRFNDLNVGGIFLDRQDSEEEYQTLIREYQNDAKIKLFVATDLEGAWTPFHDVKSSNDFPPFSEIETSREAFEVGLEHGVILDDLGFNLNFAPVAEYSDKVYGGRTFSGSEEEIAKKIENYILGLEQNVFGTCKHYPGNSMEKNLHDVSDTQFISDDDLFLFDICLKNNISAIMVSHQIVYGKLNSSGKPSTVSEDVVSSVDNSVLIVADEINMQGLKEFYPDKVKLYIDLINSGENLILDFDLNSYELYSLLDKLEKEVERGNIDEKKINSSVKKILELKGYIFK